MKILVRNPYHLLPNWINQMQQMQQISIGRSQIPVKRGTGYSPTIYMHSVYMHSKLKMGKFSAARLGKHWIIPNPINRQSNFLYYCLSVLVKCTMNKTTGLGISQHPRRRLYFIAPIVVVTRIPGLWRWPLINRLRFPG